MSINFFFLFFYDSEFCIFHLISFKAAVNKELDNILLRHCHVEAKLQSIGKVLPNVAVVCSEAQKFKTMIDHTNQLAEKVSAKVRQLDLARVSNKICFQSFSR